MSATCRWPALRREAAPHQMPTPAYAKQYASCRSALPRIGSVEPQYVYFDQSRVGSSRCLREKPTPRTRTRCCGAVLRSPGAAVPTPRIRPGPPSASYRPGLANAPTIPLRCRVFRHNLQRLGLRRIVSTQVRQQPDGPLLELPVVSLSHDFIIS